MAKSRLSALKPNNAHNIFVMLAGFFGGIIGDAFWNTQKLPGYDQPTKIPQIKWADFGQLSFYFFFLFIAIINQRHDLSNFTYGLIVGKSLSSIGMPTVGLPRYIFYDLDPTTLRLIPAREIVEKGFADLDSQAKQLMIEERGIA